MPTSLDKDLNVNGSSLMLNVNGSSLMLNGKIIGNYISSKFSFPPSGTPTSVCAPNPTSAHKQGRERRSGGI